AGAVAFRWPVPPGRTRLRIAAQKRALRQGYIEAASPQVLVTGIGPAPGTQTKSTQPKKKHKKHSG
ncbi:MAG: hypothetical protein C5B48_00930, partial [Candidatus Rokuibacteriota bacterium]